MPFLREVDLVSAASALRALRVESGTKAMVLGADGKEASTACPFLLAPLVLFPRGAQGYGSHCAHNQRTRSETLILSSCPRSHLEANTGW